MPNGDLSTKVPFLRDPAQRGVAREGVELEAVSESPGLSTGRFGGLAQLENLGINPEATGAAMLATASLGRGLISRSAVQSVTPTAKEAKPAPGEVRRPTRRPREAELAAVPESALRFERTIDTPNFLPSWFLRTGAHRAQAVCKIQTSGIDFKGDEGWWSGTGVMISENILLTNHHVINSKQVGKTAVCIFNYESDESGKLLDTKTFRCNPERLFLTSPATGGGLDFTFVWVDENPGREFGFYPIYRHSFTIANGACANIIQHPAGRPKSVVVQQNEITGQDEICLQYLTDTEEGSSGALVANNSWRPVALHHASRKIKDAEGASPAVYVNEGVKFAAIAAYLESLAPGSPVRTAADEILSLFRDTDALMGYFGALGRDSEGAATALERVVNSYQGENRDLDVGFWNIEWFNKFYRDKLDAVAQVLLQMNLDVWAFEESSPEAAEALVAHLETKYSASFDYLASEPDAPTSRQTTTIIWNRKTVHCDRLEWDQEIDRWFKTHSEDFEDIDFEAEHGRIFDRYPALFRVTSAQQEGFSFLLVALHLKAKEEGSLRRRMASRILARAIQKTIESGEDGDWVVGGDYNATLASGDFEDLTRGDLVAISAEDARDSSAFTYIKSPFRSLIDHIFLSPNLAKLADEDDFFIVARDKEIPHFLEISDHRPILVRLSLPPGEGREIPEREKPRDESSLRELVRSLGSLTAPSLPARGRRPAEAPARTQPATGKAAFESADRVARADLNLCDVLLYRGTGLMSKAIRLFDGSDVSHAGLYLAGPSHSVGEAIGEGLVRRSLDESLGHAEWVLVRRLKDLPSDMSPVRQRGERYIAEGNRYAYEQILLLAFITLIRKPKVTPIFKQVVLGVLKAASSFLLKLTSAGRQPMICSEFVYRAYDEALPDVQDRYSLRISEGELESFGQTRGSFGQGIHPDSLLGQVALRPGSLSRGPSLESSATFPEVDLETALQTYLREVQEPSLGLEASHAAPVSDPRIAQAIEEFATELYRATSPPATRRPERLTRAGDLGLESSEVPAALQHLFQTAADFVTPGDLMKTQSLFSLGRL